MRNDSTVYVGLDVHKESIIAAYAVDLGEVQDLGNVGVLQRDLDRLCERMRSKGSHVHFVPTMIAKIPLLVYPSPSMENVSNAEGAMFLESPATSCRYRVRCGDDEYQELDPCLRRDDE